VQDVHDQRRVGGPDHDHLPMAAQHHAAQGPTLPLSQRQPEHAIAGLGGRAIGHQVQAAPGIEQWIKLRRGQEAF
jgi:hypothetical protein